MASTGNGQTGSIRGTTKQVPAGTGHCEDCAGRSHDFEIHHGLADRLKRLAQSAVDTQKLQDAKAQGFACRWICRWPAISRWKLSYCPRPFPRRFSARRSPRQYAVIELTISNKSHDAALIINSVFIDYSEWLMSGSAKALAAAGLPGTFQSAAAVGTQRYSSQCRISNCPRRSIGCTGVDGAKLGHAAASVLWRGGHRI